MAILIFAAFQVPSSFSQHWPLPGVTIPAMQSDQWLSTVGDHIEGFKKTCFMRPFRIETRRAVNAIGLRRKSSHHLHPFDSYIGFAANAFFTALELVDEPGFPVLAGVCAMTTAASKTVVKKESVLIVSRLSPHFELFNVL
jgi:hypothetical protein